MNNTWRLFRSDLARLFGNVVGIIAVLGLVALPSIFSWYNILACWDVFGNTGNLTVAVANSDEGYQSDLVPLEINVGDKIIAALRENDQLDWVFTNEEDAIDGARSGRYYAAVVIPAGFSADMMSLFSDDVKHASITYYSNQKKSAIAPKVTDQGADQVSAQVNEVFAETVSEIALSISSALLKYADDADAEGALGTLAEHVSQIGSQLADSAGTLSSYSAVLQSSGQLVRNAADLLEKTGDKAATVGSTVAEAQKKAEGASTGLATAKAALDEALTTDAAQYDRLTQTVESAFSDSSAAASRAETLLREQAAVCSARGDDVRAQALYEAADRVAAANAATQAKRDEMRQQAAQAQQAFASAKTGYDQDLEPALTQLASMAAEASSVISSVSASMTGAQANLSGTAASITQQMASAQAKLDNAARSLNESAAKLADLGTGITQALASDDAQMLRTIIGSDPAALAMAIAAPVKLERIAMYPVDNFGSAMSPLYTTLALWIGALLIMVTMRPTPSARTLAELDNPTNRQVFMGRFMTVGFISLLQSSVLSVGNLLFLGVQATSPLLYVLCFWVSGLVFAFIMYTMVALFANLGKALGVILLIVQVSGGGGSFPMQLLPEFFQNMGPFLPITHAINAMRAAMFGIYQGDYWMQLGVLVLFVVPFVILGLVLHKPLGMIVPKFIERVEQSELM